jgi:hypothetical protein
MWKSLLLLHQDSITLHRRVRVAQWIARLPPKQKVAGSNPASDVDAIILREPIESFCFVGINFDWRVDS